MIDSTRGTTPTPVTDSNWIDSTHVLSVTERAQAMADERNQRRAAAYAQRPELAPLAAILKQHTATDVIAEWAEQSATVCTTCHQPIEPAIPIVITRSENRVCVRREVRHRECAEGWRWDLQTCCAWCWRPVAYHGVGRLAYCCRDCRDAAEHDRKVQKKPDNTRTCQHCEQPFTGRADARYCSTRCRVAAHRAKSPPPLARTSATSATPQQGSTP